MDTVNETFQCLLELPDIEVEGIEIRERDIIITVKSTQTHTHCHLCGCKIDQPCGHDRAIMLRNYLKTKNKQVCDTKVKNKRVGAEPDSFWISSHSALKYHGTSTTKPEFFLLPSAVTDTFFSPLI
jgi:hypothetical protein